MGSKFLFPTLAISLMVLSLPTYAQITMPCTPSMISTFTPCVNYLANSSFNGTSPSADCCNSLRSLMSRGKDCFCFITTGRVPFNIPINRTLALSLPRACNMPSVPLQCQASGAPAPSPSAFGPTVSPTPAPSPSYSHSPSPSPTSKAPESPEPLSPTLSPEADATPTPPSATTGTGAPTSNSGNSGNRAAGVTPSAAQPSLSASPLLLLAMLGVFAFKCY